MILFSAVKTQHERRSRSLQRLRVGFFLFVFFAVECLLPSWYMCRGSQQVQHARTHSAAKPWSCCLPRSSAGRHPDPWIPPCPSFCPVLLHTAVQGMWVSSSSSQSKDRVQICWRIHEVPPLWPEPTLQPIPSSFLPLPLHSRLIVSRSLCLCPSFCLYIPRRTRWPLPPASILPEDVDRVTCSSNLCSVILLLILYNLNLTSLCLFSLNLLHSKIFQLCLMDSASVSLE